MDHFLNLLSRALFRAKLEPNAGRLQAIRCLSFAVAAFVTTSAWAEGSAEFDVGDTGANNAHDQAPDVTTEMYVDILNAGAEKICWVGTGNLAVFQPDKTTSVGTLSSGTCVAAVGGVTGAYYLQMASSQAIGTEWDVRVCASSVTDSDCLTVANNEQPGRLWSYFWNFQANNSFADAFSVNGSVYAVVPGGDVSRDAVIEMEMRGVSGAHYSLSANSIGPETTAGVRVGRSVAVSGNQVTPEFRLYLNPPESAQYNWIAPAITDVQLTPECGTSVVLDTAPGAISFVSNVSGQFVVICDVNKDDVYDFAGPGDFSNFGPASMGVNTVTWNGQDNSGNNAPEGNYNCVIHLNVGEFHYVAEDIETSYPGIRMFRVESDKTTRVPLDMFWDDGNIAADAEDMNNVAGQLSPTAPPSDGLWSDDYANAASPFYYIGGDLLQPTGNARAWGNYDADGKGNNNFLDQFSAADAAISAPFVVSVIAGSGDADGDGLMNSRECELGSDPQNPDTDGDGVSDGFEASSSAAPNSDGDLLIDILDPDDDGDGIPTSTELGGENGDGNPVDATDTDGDGIPDYLDLDSDNDGVPDATDVAPTDPNACQDVDGDNCDDCLNTGADGSGGDTGNDGTDTDGDTTCDLTDPDDDNDGVCDDGVAVPGVCVAGPDTNVSNSNVCGDTDGDGCDDCASGSFDPANDGPDADGDGMCDASMDHDGDGIPEALDADDDGDGILDTQENLLGLDPSADADMDGVPNFRDADDRGDGMANDCADADDDGVCDALSELYDRDGDGIPNHWDLDSDGDTISDADESGHNAPDTNRDGIVDGPVGANGVANAVESPADSGNVDDPVDSDGDGTPDFLDLDSDNDGRTDAQEAGDSKLSTEARDTDGDGIADYIDPDDDNDGIASADELNKNGSERDTDDDGIPDQLDPDDDGDGIASADELNKNGSERDTDGDGIPDQLDPDDDGDGIPTADEDGDANNNGVPDRLEPPAESVTPQKGVLVGGALCAVAGGVGAAGGHLGGLVLFGLALTLGMRRRRCCR